MSFSTTDKNINFRYFHGDVSKWKVYYTNVKVTDQLIFASYTKRSIADETEPKAAIIHVFD
jgi:hypothetical protein